MDILVTIPATDVGTEIFPVEARDRLESLGSVTWNENESQFTDTELRERLPGNDVLVTGWGCPRVSGKILEDADRLQLITHVGGSVPAVATESIYDHGVTVCSAVRVMATFVAEGTLTHALASLRGIPQYESSLRCGDYERDLVDGDTLFDKSVGLVGLGSVGRELLKLLDPFDVKVCVYDPYVDPDQLAAFDFASVASLDTVLDRSDIVSVHAAKTPETIGLLGAEQLEKLRDGALLINTARGALVDEQALIEELRSGRISAALDVFQHEPLPEESELRTLDNVVTTPHVAGSPTGRRMAFAMIDEIERFKRGEVLQHEISRDRFRLMTRNWLSATAEDEST